MKVLLDTNRLTDLLRGDPKIVEQVEQAVEVWVPFVTMGEIKAGFLAGNRSENNHRLLHQLLHQPGIGVLFADRETSDYYARLFFQLRKAGTPIPTNDLWIASLSVQYELTLLSRDEHFDKLPQLLRG